MKTKPSFSELKDDTMRMLAEVQDAHVLARVRAILSEGQPLAEKDWWDSLPLGHQERINQGIAEIEAGRVVPHSEVLKRMQEWRNVPKRRPPVGR